MYEHMATVRNMDVVNLPTISTYITMSIPRDDIPNQSISQLGRYVICSYFYFFNFFISSLQITKILYYLELLQPRSWQLFLKVGYLYRCKLFTKAANQPTKVQKIYSYSSSGQLKKVLIIAKLRKKNVHPWFTFC